MAKEKDTKKHYRFTGDDDQALMRAVIDHNPYQHPWGKRDKVWDRIGAEMREYFAKKDANAIPDLSRKRLTRNLSEALERWESEKRAPENDAEILLAHVVELRDAAHEEKQEQKAKKQDKKEKEDVAAKKVLEIAEGALDAAAGRHAERKETRAEKRERKKVKLDDVLAAQTEAMRALSQPSEEEAAALRAIAQKALAETAEIQARRKWEEEKHKLEIEEARLRVRTLERKLGIGQPESG